jgi:SAM-dependent methyltransferase
LKKFPKVGRHEFDLTINRDPFEYEAETGREKLEESFRSFTSLLRDQNGVIPVEILDQRSCPLCTSGKAYRYLEKYGFNIEECAECQFVYTSPILRQSVFPSAELEIGPISEQHLDFISTEYYHHCAAKRFEFLLQEVLSNFEGRPEHLLEVGCSIGIGLEVATKYGLNAEGIEPNKHAASVAKQKGFLVTQSPFSAKECLGKYFDIVMSMDVLEHVIDPVGFLEEVRGVLSPSGVVMIQVPNAGALISRIEKEENQLFNGLIHLNYFDCSSLDRTASLAGLDKIKTFTILSEIGKIRRYSNDVIRAALGENAQIQQDLADLNEDWVLDNQLGYKVVGIYRRKKNREGG